MLVERSVLCYGNGFLFFFLSCFWSNQPQKCNKKISVCLHFLSFPLLGVVIDLPPWNFLYTYYLVCFLGYFSTSIIDFELWVFLCTNFIWLLHYVIKNIVNLEGATPLPPSSFIYKFELWRDETNGGYFWIWMFKLEGSFEYPLKIHVIEFQNQLLLNQKWTESVVKCERCRRCTIVDYWNALLLVIYITCIVDLHDSFFYFKFYFIKSNFNYFINSNFNYFI